MYHLVVSPNRGIQSRPPNTIILIMGIPKKVPLILGNPQLIADLTGSSQVCSQKLFPAVCLDVSPGSVATGLEGFRVLGL